jgi:hypothetical protein
VTKATLAGTYTKKVFFIPLLLRKPATTPGSGVTLDSSGKIYGTTANAGNYLLSER